MKPDILTKLAAELREPIGSERQVVYIMVELRKLIELNCDGAQYTALKFHCDWVAHPRLAGTQAHHPNGPLQPFAPQTIAYPRVPCRIAVVAA